MIFTSFPSYVSAVIDISGLPTMKSVCTRLSLHPKSFGSLSPMWRLEEYPWPSAMWHEAFSSMRMEPKVRPVL